MTPYRSARIFRAVAFLLAAPLAFHSPAFAAAANPLLDFQSDSLTQNFRESYQNVSGATVNVDVPYGLDDDQKYDVFLPETRSSAPVIVMVHGGDWSGGDKQDAAVAASKAGYWVAKGYVFVSINYRLLPKKDPLIQAADVALALASVQKNAANWSADAGKIVLMGAGAGGHLTALLSSNPSLAADQGAKPWAAAVVLETPALDIPEIMQSSHSAIYDTAFGSNLEYWEDSSPIDLLDSSGLPMMVVCSAASAGDSCGRAQAFASAADAKGISVTVSPQGLTSADVNAQLGVAGAYTSKVDNFIESVF